MPQVSFTSYFGEDNALEIVVNVTPEVPAQTYGPPEACYPAEGGEVEVLSCHLHDDKGGPKVEFYYEGLFTRTGNYPDFRYTCLEDQIDDAAYQAMIDGEY